MGLEKIKHLSKIKNISLDELSDISGVPKSTINKIINGITENPGYKTILSLSHALSLSADEFIDLLDLDLEKPQFSTSDKALIDKYNTLDAFGRQTIDLLLERELDRYKQFKQLQHKTTNLKVVETVNDPTEDSGKKVVQFSGKANDSPPVPKDEETASQRKEDPYTVIAAHNDNEDPDQYELMMEDAADLLDDDD